MRYRIELDAKQLDLVLCILGNAEHSCEHLGHLAARRVLGAIATSIKQQMSDQDKLASWGAGEGEV